MGKSSVRSRTGSGRSRSGYHEPSGMTLPGSLFPSARTETFRSWTGPSITRTSQLSVPGAAPEVSRPVVILEEEDPDAKSNTVIFFGIMLFILAIALGIVVVYF